MGIVGAGIGGLTLAHALRECGTGAESFRQLAVLDHRGRVRLRLPGCTGEDILMIGRRPLRAILARGLDTIRWSTPVEGCTDEGDGVRVHLRDGADPEVDLLVGADGPPRAARAGPRSRLRDRPVGASARS